MLNNMNLKLSDREWEQFKLASIFKIENCKCSKVSGLQKGSTPYVGATNRNNGVMNFVKADKKLITKGNCLAFICDGEGSVGYTIYKAEDFIGSTTVKVGRNEKLNKYNATFITTIADTVRSKYNFGFKRNETHLKNEILMLPANSKGEPDFEFMEAFMKQKEQEKFQEYNNYINQRIKALKDFKTVEPIEEKEFGEFKLQSIFNSTKGDQNKMTDLKKGNFPLVSAKNGNNGLKDFVTKNNKKVYSNNTLTLNNDGDGGAGISYYQPFEYLLDSHVTSLNPKSQLSRLSLLFISRCITKQRNKFGHGYALTNNRLTAFKIMLPINDQNEPDYDYMENYMKQLEYKKLNEYLSKKEKLNANA